MEFDVLIQLVIKRSGARGGEEAAGSLCLYLHFITSDFFGVIFLRHKAGWSILARSWLTCVLFAYLREFLLCGTKGSDVGLPVLCSKWLIRRCDIILLWPWIIISIEKEVFSVGNETSSVRSSDRLWGKWLAVLVICSWTHNCVSVVQEIVLLDLAVSGSKELKKILFLLLSKVALFVNVLVGTWLNFARVELLLQDVPFLFRGLISFGLSRELLHKLMVVVIPLLFVFENGFLLEDASHHLHADWLLLLIVVSRTWILFVLLTDRWSGCFRNSPVVRWGLLLNIVERWIILPRTKRICVYLGWLYFLLHRRLLYPDFSQLPHCVVVVIVGQVFLRLQ